LILPSLSACGLFDFFTPDDGPRANKLLRRFDAVLNGRPATDGGRVFITTRDHRVIALDANTGVERWSARSDSGAAESAQTLAGCSIGGAVVACGDNGDIVAFDRITGKFAWRFHPAVGRRVDVDPFIARDSTFYTGSREGAAVHAIDVKTGAERWFARVPGLEPSGIVRNPDADADLVVAAYFRSGKPTTGGVVGIEPLTGKVLWTTELPRILPDSDSSGGYAALAGDLVVASSNSGRIFGLDRQSGEVLWNVPGVERDQPGVVPRPIVFDYRPLVVVGSRLYASSMYGWLIAYDLRLHTELWRSGPGKDVGDGNGLPISSDGEAIYVTYLSGAVVTFAAADGAVRSIANKTDLLFSIALGSDRFFAPGDHGLWAYAK